MVKTNISVDWQRKRVALLGKQDFLQCLVRSPRRKKKDAVPLMCCRIAVVELDCALEFGFGTLPIPVVVELHVPQGGVRLRERRIDLDGALGMPLGHHER